MSRKTGKITKVEKFYINNNPNLDASDLAKDLNRSVSFVKEHAEKVDTGQVDTGHVDTAQEEKTSAGELFGHKGDRGVTIMTPAASEVSDETRSTRINVSKKHRNAIHVIKPDKK